MLPVAVSHNPNHYVFAKHMTLRQAFAMAAMQGLLANPEEAAMTEEDAARFAVKCADCLLDELATREPK